MLNHLKVFSLDIDEIHDLDLPDSKICLIEDNSFKSLINLEKLNIRNNFLTHIRYNSFKGLSKLKELEKYIYWLVWTAIIKFII